MAVIDPVFSLATAEEKNFIWETLTSANPTGRPVDIAKYTDKSVQIFGTFDTTTVLMQGSNDPRANPDHPDHASAVWETLPDPQGNAISKTANALEQILDNTKWIRPNLSVAGAGSDIDVAIVAIRNYF
jgi:hypothetical protein